MKRHIAPGNWTNIVKKRTSKEQQAVATGACAHGATTHSGEKRKKQNKTKLGPKRAQTEFIEVSFTKELFLSNRWISFKKKGAGLTKITYFFSFYTEKNVKFFCCFVLLLRDASVCERKLVKGEKKQQRPPGLDVCAFTRDSERVKSPLPLPPHSPLLSPHLCPGLRLRGDEKPQPTSFHWRRPPATFG